MKKHYAFVNIFSYIWFTLLANSYFMMSYHYKILEEMDDGSDTNDDLRAHNKTNLVLAKDIIIVQFAFVILIMCQGVILAIYRFKEPVYYNMIKVEVKSWFGLISPDELKLAKEQSS